MCHSKKPKYIVNEEASRLLSNLGITTLLSKLDLHIVLVDRLLKTTKEYKNLKKQEIQDIFIKTNQKKVAFSMILLRFYRIIKKNSY